VALVTTLPVVRDSHFGDALHFFYDTPNVLLLLAGFVLQIAVR
jgi:hypothetical protein